MTMVNNKVHKSAASRLTEPVYRMYIGFQYKRRRLNQDSIDKAALRSLDTWTDHTVDIEFMNENTFTLMFQTA